ncbi:hypothetical protein TgHK011_009375 [Trichoderma gracile]|nr:hypothetical protein TgHK011_009375 [Trichoderma gracile]
MGEPSTSAQTPSMGYTIGQKHHHQRHHHQQDQQQQQGELSSSPERVPYLERSSSSESAGRRMSEPRPSYSGSGFLGTMR